MAATTTRPLMLSTHELEEGWKAQLKLNAVPFAQLEQQAQLDNMVPRHWEGPSSATALAAANEQEMLDVRRLLQPVTGALQGGRTFLARQLCVGILRREMEAWSTGQGNSDAPMSLRMALLETLKVLRRFHPQIADPKVHQYLVWASQTMLLGAARSDVQLLTLTQDLVGYLLKSKIVSDWSFKTCLEILELAKGFTGEDADTLQKVSRAYVAEQIVYFDQAISNLKQRDDILHQHFQSLTPDTIPPSGLRYGYAYGMDLVINGKIDEAIEVMRCVFDARQYVFGEVHEKTPDFIDELLEEYCEAWKGTTHRDALWSVLNDFFINDLVDYCLENGRIDEAETIAQECFTRIYSTSRSTSNDVFWPWYEIDVHSVQCRLAKYQTPSSSFYWEDSRMYLKIWNEVEMIPVSLDEQARSDTLTKPNEKDVWGKPVPKVPRRLMYKILDTGKNSVNVRVPYVDYEQFQKSAGLDKDQGYFDYLQQTLELTILRPEDAGGKSSPDSLWLPAGDAALIKGATRAHPTYCSRIGADSTTGLFNGIPTGAAYLDHSDVFDGFNFVSSQWLDWRHFPLQALTTEKMPNLTMLSKQQPRCLGFIFGKWTKLDDLSRQWKRVKVYVLDCAFSREEYSQKFNFVINPASLGENNSATVTSSEKRILAAHLNPSLFRYAPPKVVSFGSMWKPSRKKKVKDLTAEDTFWDEMNRRETWDRSFDNRLQVLSALTSPSDDETEQLARLYKERKVEEDQRLAWDMLNVSLKSA